MFLSRVVTALRGGFAISNVLVRMARSQNNGMKLAVNEMPETFERIYRTNHWKSEHSVSGPGSTPEITAKVTEGLRKVISDLRICSLVDASCGDANWIAELTPMLHSYIGIDIVAELIENNRGRYASMQNMEFRHGDITSMVMPDVDAILCRDCFVHLPFDSARQALGNMVSEHRSVRYLILTTFPGWPENKDIARPGLWRPLDMMKPPFSLPEPVGLIRERAVNPKDRYNMKSLGVWDADEVFMSLIAR